MRHLLACLTVYLGLAVATSAHAVTNLLTNPGYLDTDVPADGVFGDGWGVFGAANFNAFFGAGNPHASLFGDDAFNVGGVYQQGILGSPGTTYQFDMINTRIESAWDADLNYGIEFYAADDTTLLGETLVTADTAARLALPNVDGGGAVNGAMFSMQATAPAGTVFARPVIKFDNVNLAYVAPTAQANAFVFNSFLSEVPAPGGELLKNPGFEDEDGQGDLGDFWGSFGNAGFNDFFGGGGNPNGHASLFADLPGNSGGIFQQSVLGTAGTQYEFILSDVRIESNFDADLSFGLEYYADDDFTKISDTIIAIDTNTGMVDGNAFVMSGTAPAGTKFIRPIVLFDNVVSTAVSDESVFIFDASLVELSTITNDADFDTDGDVDGADFLIWQRGLGAAGGLTQGDANSSGFVDATDLAIWETQYGSGNPILAAAVPEPSSFALMLFAALALSSCNLRAARG